MSAPTLVPNLTGKSVYATPQQSPEAHETKSNPFENGDDSSGRETEMNNEKQKPLNVNTQPGTTNGTNTFSEKMEAPVVPARPGGREFPFSATLKDTPQKEAAPSPIVPLVPPRPNGREFPFSAILKKEPPQLPGRPPSQTPVATREPKPTPELPNAVSQAHEDAIPPQPSRRPAQPPPTIVEENIPTGEGGQGSFKYTRDPERLVAYLIPLPTPVLRKNSEHEDLLPERFIVYTPPKPHLLKPAKGVKEGKRRWCKRKLQQEVEKATKYEGKTFSIRGLHSKGTKGVVWAIRRIRRTDIVFLGRIESKEVDEILLVFPTSVDQNIPEVRTEFISQITRTKRKAVKESVISTILLPITLVIDTFAAVIWPFGGLFEIDAVWAYASIKGWTTSRVITKRLGHRESRLGKYGGTERDLYLRFHQDEKVDVLKRYLAECCHKKDPKTFDSAGVPPTEGDVREAIGWAPVVRGSTGGVRAEGENGWADEEWQRTVFDDDFKATMERGAASWAKWTKKFEKNAEKALKK